MACLRLSRAMIKNLFSRENALALLLCLLGHRHHHHDLGPSPAVDLPGLLNDPFHYSYLYVGSFPGFLASACQVESTHFLDSQPVVHLLAAALLNYSQFRFLAAIHSHHPNDHYLDCIPEPFIFPIQNNLANLSHYCLDHIGACLHALF